jgi:hypothetical protein
MIISYQIIITKTENIIYVFENSVFKIVQTVAQILIQTAAIWIWKTGQNQVIEQEFGFSARPQPRYQVTIGATLGPPSFKGFAPKR